MRYLNRNGIEIGKEAWSKLIRNVKYSRIKSIVIDEFRVQLNWIGVHSELEKEPKLFCLSNKNEKGNINKFFWYCSEKEGIEAFNLLVEKLNAQIC